MSHVPFPTETPGADAVFDPLDPGFFDDPYRHYAVLRAQQPVYLEPRVDAYLVTRYEDVHRLARDRSMLVEVAKALPTPRIMARATRNATLATGPPKWMVFRDGEDHTRLRRILSPLFTPRAVAVWRERIEVVVDRLLSAVQVDRPFDVVSQFAKPLPAQIISEMVGVPEADIPQLLEWSHTLVRTIESLNTPEQEEAVVTAVRRMSAYLEPFVTDTAARAAGSIVAALVDAGQTDDRVSVDEMVAQLMMLYVAGHETTENLIGNGLVHLFERPDELARLRADPSLDANAIEELLRFDAPIQLIRRIAASPFELHGVAVPAGADMLLCLGAGNRDPGKWGDDADVLDLSRPDAAEHLSFGGGAHHCLGAWLARLEAAIALPRLLRRFPALAPAYERPAWARRMVLRGVEELPVNVRGR